MKQDDGRRKATLVAAPLSSDQLWDLYKIPIDEYRFEVKLGWDRAMYYMVFNSAIVSVATGLLKLDNPPIVYVFVAGIFLLGCFTSFMGVQAIARCHDYYRRTEVKKTLIENLLGLAAPLQDHSGHTLTIGTTPGQGDHIQILQNTEQWVGRALRRYSIMFWVTSFLRFLAGINLIGVFVAGYMFLHPPATFHESRQPFILPIAIRLLWDETAPAGPFPMTRSRRGQRRKHRLNHQHVVGAPNRQQDLVPASTWASSLYGNQMLSPPANDNHNRLQPRA